jgi:hypothetical protein
MTSPPEALEPYVTATRRSAQQMIEDLSPWIRSASEPYVTIHLIAVIHPAGEWRLAHLMMDMLGTELSDSPPFAPWMRLEAPTRSLEGFAGLRLQLGVPANAADELQRRLTLLIEEVIGNVVGPDLLHVSFASLEKPEPDVEPPEVDVVALAREFSGLLQVDDPPDGDR